MEEILKILEMYNSKEDKIAYLLRVVEQLLKSKSYYKEVATKNK
jgi:hypothetical protein